MINPHISAKYCTTLSQNSPKCRLYKRIFIMNKFNWSFICYICKEKGYVLADVRKFQVRKSQIRKGSHLRKGRKSNTLFKSANLRIWGTYLRIALLSEWPYFILFPIVAAAKEYSNFVAARPILKSKHWQCNFFKDRNFVSKCHAYQPFPMVKCFLSYGKNKNTKYNLFFFT